MSTVEAPPGETVRLPRSLVRRVAWVLAEDGLGYLDLQDFVHAALRRELDTAERKAFHLRQEREPPG